MPNFKRRALWALLGLAVAPWPAFAADAASSFPGKPVRIISPFPVGGGPDGVARVLADKLSRTWGYPLQELASDLALISVADIDHVATQNHHLFVVSKPIGGSDAADGLIAGGLCSLGLHGLNDVFFCFDLTKAGAVGFRRVAADFCGSVIGH